ncbi:hypothetical protein [Mycoplasma feriruminatoris]|uniref:hypothetical protein n=1 Tax=Mycoplasma feriruminatoris TaxID=1179777 RepID=UPI00241F489E|nr:hypothetical protein [Mycoplasma feriruminatoris]
MYLIDWWPYLTFPISSSITSLSTKTLIFCFKLLFSSFCNFETLFWYKLPSKSIASLTCFGNFSLSSSTIKLVFLALSNLFLKSFSHKLITACLLVIWLFWLIFELFLFVWQATTKN